MNSDLQEAEGVRVNEGEEGEGGGPAAGQEGGRHQQKTRPGRHARHDLLIYPIRN